MNKRGNIMINLMFFVMALGVLIVFINPINSMLDLIQQSDNMNCKGYVSNGDVNNPLSFNATKNNNASGSPLGCTVIKLYLPYLLIVFLVGGITAVLANRFADNFGFLPQEQNYYN